MGRTANFTGGLIWSLIMLGCAIAAIVFGAKLIDGSAQDLLIQLSNQKDILKVQIMELQNQLPMLIACPQILWNAIDFLNNSTQMVFSACAANSELIEAETAELATLTTSSLNTTLQQSITDSCALILQFQDEISYVANNQTVAVPFLVTSGTCRVTVLGTIEKFVDVNYEVREITLGTLRLRYALIKKWDQSVQFNETVANGFIVYDQFQPSIVADFADSCDISRPFIVEQTDKFVFSSSGSKAQLYNWNCANGGVLGVQWSGTTLVDELMNQNEDLTLLGTVL